MDAITLSTGRIIVLNEDEAVEVQNYFLRKADKEQCREYLEKNLLPNEDIPAAIPDEEWDQIAADMRILCDENDSSPQEAIIAGYVNWKYNRSLVFPFTISGNIRVKTDPEEAGGSLMSVLFKRFSDEPLKKLPYVSFDFAAADPTCDENEAVVPVTGKLLMVGGNTVEVEAKLKELFGGTLENLRWTLSDAPSPYRQYILNQRGKRA